MWQLQGLAKVVAKDTSGHHQETHDLLDPFGLKQTDTI